MKFLLSAALSFAVASALPGGNTDKRSPEIGVSPREGLGITFDMDQFGYDYCVLELIGACGCSTKLSLDEFEYFSDFVSKSDFGGCTGELTITKEPDADHIADVMFSTDNCNVGCTLDWATWGSC